ncbi:4-hydroxybenzoate octaprenyltransferase [Ascoidea rubescens DSM 1968]|uniref:4-hydroxybenzoate polyprenyltransferase, mitochondrial n=1 Tax=Ascoidea rubescens DSM 1968 TaxID=1344418 RepID=A0A1D2VKQ8_9ASCO|nr:4-hydroxybenzoate polyprenyl transferase [Ascoidea rubescens DSM 1968]ODV62189.1 4-hydroxybenzoate polyprenyl transferase [Ascoidea rubescens DSM 1968]
MNSSVSLSLFGLPLRSSFFSFRPLSSTLRYRPVVRNFRWLTSSANHKFARPAPAPAPNAFSLFTKEQIKAAKAARALALSPSWVSKLPEKWIPYAELMRLERPVGTWLLFLPSSWGIVMASYQAAIPLSQCAWMLGVFGIGSIVMRGAGCTINDICDRDFDNKVERTIERPLASKKVTVRQASVFLFTQLCVGLMVLLQLPFDCFLLGASSLAFVLTYPLFKRFTYYPQAVLSICNSWGTMLGFAAMGVWDWSTMVPLFFSSYLWTMVYDTIYAHQDKKFDVQAGVKSTALAWGNNSKKIFYSLSAAHLSLLAIAGINGAMGPGFFIGASVFGYRLLNSIKTVNLDYPKDCWKHFFASIASGQILLGGIILDYVLRLLGFI